MCNLQCNSGAGLVYCGVPALDVMNYPLYKHFTRAAEFIQQALDSGGELVTQNGPPQGPFPRPGKVNFLTS